MHWRGVSLLIQYLCFRTPRVNPQYVSVGPAVKISHSAENPQVQTLLHFPSFLMRRLPLPPLP